MKCDTLRLHGLSAEGVGAEGEGQGGCDGGSRGSGGGCEGGSGGDEGHSSGELILRNCPPSEIQERKAEEMRGKEKSQT